ncbi:uncharacterized protein SETTUDRAFT_39582 [Exserohilum turcica Et28A]|uniref:DUF6594 domain-containing protein n=1 Tax=Exserohilum turcicum (strain 28A) TaxID=671987 RepID=R0JZY4_EXST2|nr:uncharacterized protein SETTUDRAFT_39582 [Exserohilum turcica Et28A]EOA86453.1 hypothetical protein SETTUDRAFT_39582 [Exserohilum turcica Et28A]
MAGRMNSYSTGPSLKERIRALYNFSETFEAFAPFPQALVHERFFKAKGMAIAYVESEVYKHQRAVETYLRESLESKDSEPDETVYTQTMNLFVRDVLRHDQLTEGGRKMWKARSPSALAMRQYRWLSRVNEPGVRAANGELASKYGDMGKMRPSDLATMFHEDLAPMEQFVLRMANPVWHYLVNPYKDLSNKFSERLISLLPIHRVADYNQEGYEDSVAKETLEAVANVLVYMLLTLILVAPIAIFNTVESQKVRIAVMPFCCLLLISSAHRMGEKPMLMATLATA